MSALARLHTRAALDAFDIEQYVVELPPDLEFGPALAEIDDAMTRVMRIELDTALADDTSLPTPTRKVFAGTIAAYAGKLDLLASRVPGSAAPLVVAAAQKTLALREALRAKVFDAAAAAAREAIADADARAKDRTLDDKTRRNWSAMRRELEATIADPTRVATPFATRLAAWPELIDEPAAQPEVTFADMIEID